MRKQLLYKQHKSTNANAIIFVSAFTNKTARETLPAPASPHRHTHTQIHAENFNFVFFIGNVLG